MSSEQRLANLGIPTGLSLEEEKKRLAEACQKIERELAVAREKHEKELAALYCGVQ